MKKKIEEIAQYVIGNRYPKSEKQKMSDHELYHFIVDSVTELLSNAEGEVKDFRQYCLDNIGFVIERGFDADIDGHQEPWFSLEYPTIENEEEKEGREPSNEELALFYLSEELFNASQPTQKGERV